MAHMKSVKGSYTVETALIMPVIMLILVLSVTLTFYYYDKCILAGLASEASAAAAEEIRCDKSISEIKQNVEKATGRRLLFFSKGAASINEKSDEVTVVITVKKGILPMKCEVKASACTKEAEKYIRLYKMLKRDE